MKIRKRSIRGYSPDTIRRQSESLREEHQCRMEGLQEELQSLKEENTRLREYLALEDAKLFPSKTSVESRVGKDADALYDMHLKMTISVMGEMEKLARLSEEHKEQLDQKQQERSQLIQSLEIQIEELLGRLRGKEETM